MNLMNSEPVIAALHCDKAYSLPQFQRRWPDIDPSKLPGVLLVTHKIAEQTGRRSQNITFVVLEEMAKLKDFQLRHLAGVAEMRYALKAPISEWENDSHKVHINMEPDAIWHSPEGPCAIEYDLAYNRKIVLEKQRVFQQFYSRQYWGTAVPSRALHLRRTLEAGPHTCILLAPWLGLPAH